MRELLLIFLLSASAFGASLERQSVLVSFPEISYRDNKVYFANSDWVAVYSAGAGAMFTVPRDSMEIPTNPGGGRNCIAIVGNATYSCNPMRGDGLVKQDAYGHSDKIIPPPNDQSLKALSDAWKLPGIPREQVIEELGPLAAAGERVWFGLLAFHGRGQDPVSGLGWFDTRTETFGRVYSPELRDITPRWVGVREDTVFVYCSAIGEANGGKLIAYSIPTGNLFVVNPQGFGIPGDTLLNVDLWNDNLLLSTEQAVCIWPRDKTPWVWQTDAYASRMKTWLKFVTFDTKEGLAYVGDDFFPLEANRPAQAFARVGDWIELLSTQGIEAAMPTEEWKKRKSKIQDDDWECGGKLCFARVQVSVQGSRKAMDLLDAPLIPIEEGATITKVGMRAGWVRYDDVVPVLMKK